VDFDCLIYGYLQIYKKKKGKVGLLTPPIMSRNKKKVVVLLLYLYLLTFTELRKKALTPNQVLRGREFWKYLESDVFVKRI